MKFSSLKLNTQYLEDVSMDLHEIWNINSRNNLNYLREKIAAVLRRTGSCKLLFVLKNALHKIFGELNAHTSGGG